MAIAEAPLLVTSKISFGHERTSGFTMSRFPAYAAYMSLVIPTMSLDAAALSACDVRLGCGLPV
eukprot:3252910-Prymnesium_polylepis.1